MNTTTAPTFDILACDFSEIEVRVLAHLGQPWFIGSDVRRILGHAGQGSFYRGLAADEMMDAPADSVRELNALRGSQDHGSNLKRAKLVSESGLYKLIMRSEKDIAKPFQEWVTREVLPAIRRSGGYRLAGTAPEAVEEGTVAEMPDVGKWMRQPATEMASYCWA